MKRVTPYYANEASFNGKSTGLCMVRGSGNHTSAHAPRLWSRGQRCAVGLRYKKANNMDAAVAAKRKHFDTDEDATNRKVLPV